MGGRVPRVSSVLSPADRVGWWKVRWGIGRGSFIVSPGLYAVGLPGSDSDVFVTASYKMSFDHLRRALNGLDAWILVLDTLGINVWCAAGKGTFGTDELLNRIQVTKLNEIVKTGRLMLPQLGASGVDSHAVAKGSGFRAIFGPVRAADIPDFLSAGMKATREMRTVSFGFKDRIILVPAELVISAKYVLLATVILMAASGFGDDGYSVRSMLATGWRRALLLIAAWLGGAFVGPALLPYLPGRSFSLKGATAGIVALCLTLIAGVTTEIPLIEQIAWLLIIPSTASFLTMNFTGASTYTSPSGVRREMKMFVPLQATAAAIGLVLLVASFLV